MRNYLFIWLLLTQSCWSLAQAQSARALTRDYVTKTGMTSPMGRETIYHFLDGLEEAGLMTNLVDFAFFGTEQNVSSGAPVSLNNTGIVTGTILTLKWGCAFDNYTNNNGLVFTNLPPTPQGRTVLVWSSASMHKNISNNLHNAIFELTGIGGPWPPPHPVAAFLYVGGGAPSPHIYNGSVQQNGTGHPRSYYNSFMLASIATSVAGAQTLQKSAYPDATSVWSTTTPMGDSPKVLRFADRHSLSNTTCSWPGLIRGFAYFNKVLNTNQVLEIDKLVPRVGAIFEGDSKTAANDWYLHYCETTNTWGLYSVLTNSAVSGTVVSSLNASSGSMEHRWPNNARFRTNSQMPRIVYALRGGHNDFSGPNIAQGRYITNAFKSITNLWGLSRSNGWMAMGWTIDRTGTTWSGNNTNYLKLLNGWIRQHSHLCDALMDAEDWFVANFGETPFTNPNIYQAVANPIHETTLGAELLGRAAGMMAAPSLPEPPFKLSILPGEAPGSQVLEVSGAPERTEIDILYSTNNRDWFELRNVIPEAGWAEIPLEQPPEATMRFYMARTRVMNVTP